MARPLAAPHNAPTPRHMHPQQQWRVLPSLAALPPRRPAPPPRRGLVACSNSDSTPEQAPQAFTPGDLPTQGDAIVGGGLGDEVDAPVSVLVKERSRDVDYLAGNHIYTSGATGTNAAVIRGALRAENAELLTVVLPQSLSRQPAESQELLSQVEHVVEMPQNDELPLQEASRICNRDIVSRVQQVICFAFHDSSLMLETCQDARSNGKLVTLFYLD